MLQIFSSSPLLHDYQHGIKLEKNPYFCWADNLILIVYCIITKPFIGCSSDLLIPVHELHVRSFILSILNKEQRLKEHHCEHLCAHHLHSTRNILIGFLQTLYPTIHHMVRQRMLMGRTHWHSLLLSHCQTSNTGANRKPSFVSQALVKSFWLEHAET